MEDTRYDYCTWCWVKVRVPEHFDERIMTCYCSRGCRDAEWLFRMHFSDKFFKEGE